MLEQTRAQLQEEAPSQRQTQVGAPKGEPLGAVYLKVKHVHVHRSLALFSEVTSAATFSDDIVEAHCCVVTTGK